MMLTKLGRLAYLLQKYEHPHIVMETEELKEMRELLSHASAEVSTTIAERVEEES